MRLFFAAKIGSVQGYPKNTENGRNGYWALFCLLNKLLVFRNKRKSIENGRIQNGTVFCLLQRFYV
jgi:hypothetical protein